MFNHRHHHNGHTWLYLLSFLGAFLLGKECERMRIRKKFAHIHGHHHYDDIDYCGCDFDDEEPVSDNTEHDEAVNPS